MTTARPTVGSVLQVSPLAPGERWSVGITVDGEVEEFRVLGWAIVVTNAEGDEYETDVRPLVLYLGHPYELHTVLDDFRGPGSPFLDWRLIAASEARS